MAVPAGMAVETIEDCAAHGVRAAVVFTSGFAETGPDGAVQQRRMGEIARASGMRVLGPNCLGVYNAAIGFFATFTTTLDLHRPRPGPVAVVSQSGAYGAHLGLLAHRRRIGIEFWVTTGNECDVTAPECIEWMAARPEVKVVAAYAEGVREGDALIGAFDAARACGKPVFFTKAGRSPCRGRGGALAYPPLSPAAPMRSSTRSSPSTASSAPAAPRRCSTRPMPRASASCPRVAESDS